MRWTIAMAVLGGMLMLVCRSDAQEDPLEEDDPLLAEPPAEAPKPDIRGRLALANIFLSEELNMPRAITCYRAFSELADLTGVQMAATLAAGFDDAHPTIDAEGLDILWGLAVCTGATAQFTGDTQKRVDRLEIASSLFRAYAKLEKREEHLRPGARVADAEEHAGVLLDAADRVRDATADWQERDGGGDMEGESSAGPSYEEAIAAATDLLANQRGQECHDAYSVLYFHPGGRGKTDPDVLWGVASCAEIVAGDVPDPPRRHVWRLAAIEWYRSYVGVEQRPEHLVPGTGRVAVAAVRIARIERQIAEAEQVLAVANPGSAVVAAANSTRVPIERVPLSNARIDAAPPPQEEPAPVDPLALLRCYASRGLLNVALVGNVGQRESTGRIRPPPVGTPCDVN